MSSRPNVTEAEVLDAIYHAIQCSDDGLSIFGRELFGAVRAHLLKTHSDIGFLNINLPVSKIGPDDARFQIIRSSADAIIRCRVEYRCSHPECVIRRTHDI